MTNWVLPHIDVPMSGHCFNGKSNFWGKVLSTSEWFQIHWNEVAFLVLSLPFLLLWCCLYAHHLMSRKTTGFNNDIDRPWYALMHSCMNCLEYWYCISETGWMWNRGVGVGEQAESPEEYPSKWKLIFKLNLKVYLQINMKICLQIQCENIPSNLSSKIRLSGMPCIDQNRVKVNFSLAPVFKPANHIKPNLSLLPWQPFVKS